MSRLVFIIYIFITILSILSVTVTTATISDVISGLIYMWFCLFFFVLAVRNKDKVMFRGVAKVRISRVSFINIEWVMCALLVFSALYTSYYYTGNSFIDIWVSLKSGVSIYNRYQQYYINHIILQSPIKKIIPIVLNFFIDYAMIFYTIQVFTLKKSASLKQKIVPIVAIFSKLYFGVSRGTNMELFEVAFLLVYCISARKVGLWKRIIYPAAIAFICSFCFIFVIRQRGVGGFVRISYEIYTDVNATITQLLPEGATLVAYLSAYFAFGVYYLSFFLGRYWVSGLQRFALGLMPMGYLVTNTDLPNTMSTPRLISVCWTPDIIRLIYVLGIAVGPMSYFILGWAYRIVQKRKAQDNNILVLVLEFLIVFQLFSMPVGNFVWISSATRLTAIVTLLYLLFYKKKTLACAKKEVYT